MSSETEELPTGRDSMERELGGRVPLPEWNPTQSEPKEYSRGDAGIVDAANDLTNERGSTEDPLDVLVDKRQPKEGGRKFYDTVENAAHDLSEYHKAEAVSELAPQLADVAAAVDYTRQVAAGAIPQDAQQPAQAEALQQPADAPQPEIGEQPSGLSPKLQQALQDPEIRQAFEAPYQAAEQTRQAYSQAAAQIAETSIAGLFASFPELQGLNSQQLPIALQLIERQNPQRRAEIDGHLNRTAAIVGAARQAQAQQAQIDQQRYQAWSKTEDDRLLAKIPELANDTDMKVSKAAVRALNDVGYTNDELAAAWQGAPISMRDHRAQLLIWKAAQYDIAKANAHKPAPREVPHVMRPGVATSPGDRAYVDLSELRNEFKKASGNDQIRAAVKLQQAQRAARR